MAFVPAPNIVMVEIVALKDGQIIENRFHVDVLHVPTDADLGAIQPVVTAWISASYAPLLPAEVTITGLKLTSLHVQNGPFRTVSLSVAGTQTGGAMPNEVTLCVSLRSAVRGRSARGRWYLLGVPKSAMATENRVSTTYRNAAVGALQTLITALGAISAPMMVVSYRNNNAPRVGGPVYFLILFSVTTDDVVDSQRRRRPGIGA